MTQNVSDTLNRAADLIEERGWRGGSGWVIDFTGTRQEAYRQPSTLCLEGGIMAALGLKIVPDVLDNGFASLPDEKFYPLWTCPAYTAVQQYLNMEPGLDEGGSIKESLYSWNDRRTAPEVIEVLRATAVIAAARETEHAAATS